MLHIDSEVLARNKPEAKKVFESLNRYFTANPNKQAFRTRGLARELHPFGDDTASKAILWLVENKYFQIKYCLVDSSGQQVGRFYDSPLDIPDEVESDDVFERINSSDCVLETMFVQGER